MPIIKSFDDALNYVNRLGLAGSGSIQARQDNLGDNRIGMVERWAINHPVC